MPTILPPPSTPQPLPAGSPPATVVAVSTPPTSVTQLAPGAVIRADIVQALTRGIVEAQTEFGVLQLRTTLALVQGARLELLLLRTAPQVQFAVRTVDGHAVVGTPARPGTPPSVHQPGPAPATPPSGTPGSALGGSALGGSAVVISASPPLGPLAAGSVVRATLHAPAPSAAAGPIATVVSSSLAVGGPPASSVGALKSMTAPPNAQLEIRILNIVGPGQARTGAGAGTSPQGPIEGTITAFSSNGRPVVQTPLGLMTLEAAPTDLSLGTQIRFALATAPAHDAGGMTSLSQAFIQSRSWPALDEAVAHLAQRPPGSPAVPLALPQANNQLAASLLLFLNALRSGDAGGWLGNAAVVLDSERADLAARVNDEFAQLARVFNDAPADDWRTAIVPFFNGAQLEPVQMHIRGGKSQRGDKGDDEGSRFIIDIELSQLGRIQFDGFVKKRSQEKKSFDLIVRTAQPLPQRMRYDINQIFTGFGEAAGLAGLITFQARAPFIDVPMWRVAPVAEDGLVV